MTRSIRLVVAASSPVLSVDDETNRNREKHERSLLKVVSDAGSTPAASTIVSHSKLVGYRIFENLKCVERVVSPPGGRGLTARVGLDGRFSVY